VENPWPWLALVLVVVAGLLIWLFAIRGHSDRATVPVVVGLSQPAAIKKLNDAGFDVKAVQMPGKPPAGRVFAQKPGAGTQLKKKQVVEIDVSNGVAPKPAPPPKTTTATTTTAAALQVAVPDVTGKAQPEAGAAIEAAGLVPDTFPATGSTQTPGVVVTQNPAAGTKILAGKAVHLDVSTGTGTQPDVTVPDVTNAKAADARAKLWAAKLTTLTTYAKGAVGVVLRQQPSGGGQAPAFTQVALTVGR
jgi:serine/threonine-protein kinase